MHTPHNKACYVDSYSLRDFNFNNQAYRFTAEQLCNITMLLN